MASTGTHASSRRRRGIRRGFRSLSPSHVQVFCMGWPLANQGLPPWPRQKPSRSVSELPGSLLLGRRPCRPYEAIEHRPSTAVFHIVLSLSFLLLLFLSGQRCVFTRSKFEFTKATSASVERHRAEMPPSFQPRSLFCLLLAWLLPCPLASQLLLLLLVLLLSLVESAASVYSFRP